MITFLAGLLLFVLTYFYTPGAGFGPTSLLLDEDGMMTDRGMWILFGMLLGTIMWYNVWMIIWPTQKRLLTGKVPADQIPAARKRALLTSRINSFLSGPMLFAMLAPAHYGTMSPKSFAAAIGLGVVAIWASIRCSSMVGKLA